MKLATRILSYILTALLACCLTLLVLQRTAGGISKLDQLEMLIRQCFIEEPDITAMEDAAAEAMVDSLGDRWSHYLSAADYAAYEERSSNAYVGIGVTVQAQEDPAGLHIILVQEGSPAMEADLREGDVILSVEGQSMDGLSVEDAKYLIRGKEGTRVQLEILRNGEVLNKTVARKKFQTPVAVGEMLDSSIGLVTIYNFDSRCARETIAAIEELTAAGANALIFDVRFNPGGYATELVKVLDYLLPEGDLFRTVDYAGKEQTDRSDAACLELPMAVLCNESSYSAAEFFAAALQEYEAAVIVGQQTVGKGYFQKTYQLSDGSAVALSVGKYFTPQGRSLIGTGIQPDISVALDKEADALLYYGKLPHEEDSQLLAAMEALQ